MSHFDGLPTELLQAIMLADVIGNDGDPRRFVWVSTTWAGVSLTTTALWASIAVIPESRTHEEMNPWSVDGPTPFSVQKGGESRTQWCSFQFLPSCLRRCGMKPRILELCSDLDSTFWIESQNLLQLQLDRCESLRVEGVLGDIPAELTAAFHSEMPALTHLEIEDTSLPEEACDDVVSTLFKSVVKSSTLVSFKGHGTSPLLFFAYMGPKLAYITELHLESYLDNRILEELYTCPVFVQLRALETLHLVGMPLPNLQDHYDSAQILPALENLTLEDSNPMLLELHARGVGLASKITFLSIKMVHYRWFRLEFTPSITLPSLRSLIMIGTGVIWAPYIIAPKLEEFRVNDTGIIAPIRFAFEAREPAHTLDPTMVHLEILSVPSITLRILKPFRRLKSLRLIHKGDRLHDMLQPPHAPLWDILQLGMVGLVPELESLCLDIVVPKWEKRSEPRRFLRQFVEARRGSPLREVTCAWKAALLSEPPEVIWSR